MPSTDGEYNIRQKHYSSPGDPARHRDVHFPIRSELGDLFMIYTTYLMRSRCLGQKVCSCHLNNIHGLKHSVFDIFWSCFFLHQKRNFTILSVHFRRMANFENGYFFSLCSNFIQVIQLIKHQRLQYPLPAFQVGEGGGQLQFLTHCLLGST